MGLRPEPLPAFLSGARGRLFALYHPPAVEEPGAAPHLVLCPPFAEEMNRSRRMVALQARRLATAGIGSLILDLFGTGESEGDFAGADWAGWRGDVEAGAGWLRSRDVSRIGLWGLGAGCLLALDAARSRAEPPAMCLLWQPALLGRDVLRRFLRLRVAGGSMRGAAPETVSGLTARLEAGEPLEVAGYTLAPALARALGGLALADLAPPPGSTVGWLEVAGSPSPELRPRSREIVDRWRRTGARIETHAVPGPPFWSTVEVAEAPALLAATDRFVATAVAGETVG